ncbi:MAG: flagellar biosynthetic protein FliQ [Epulopiscium sp. Nuni2H_MBin001]|nr:MAG: flagellar biosynthetic protein FliQ [Epulopiscium sp. Nuni2H_MBin001]
MQQLIVDAMREAILLMIQVAAPLLLVALVIGLTISIFQTATSIQEQTLTFVPKIVCVFGALIIFGPWMIAKLTTFISVMVDKFSIYLV